MDLVNNGSGSHDKVSSNNFLKHKNQYHQNSPELVAQLEGFFKNNPNPNESERKELGRELGVDPRRIQVWFQNKRKQMKTQIARVENQALKEENQRIHLENTRMREIQSYTLCSSCQGLTTATEHHDDRQHILQQLRIENARLKEEWDYLVQFVASFPEGPRM